MSRPPFPAIVAVLRGAMLDRRRGAAYRRQLAIMLHVTQRRRRVLRKLAK